MGPQDGLSSDGTFSLDVKIAVRGEKLVMEEVLELSVATCSFYE
jgi:hypothetical protein